MASTLEQWALPRLQQLLPLDNDSLKQVIQYTDSLPKDEAAEHLKNLLGDDAKALDFISSFNLRRQNAPAPVAAMSQATQQRRTDHDREGAMASAGEWEWKWIAARACLQGAELETLMKQMMPCRLCILICSTTTSRIDIRSTQEQTERRQEESEHTRSTS